MHWPRNYLFWNTWGFPIIFRLLILFLLFFFSFLSRLHAQHGAQQGLEFTTLRSRPELRSRVRCLTDWGTPQLSISNLISYLVRNNILCNFYSFTFRFVPEYNLAWQMIHVPCTRKEYGVWFFERGMFYKCQLGQVFVVLFKTFISWDAWLVQSVKHLTLDFSSGHDPRVLGSSSMSGSVLSIEPAWDSLSVSLCPLPSRTLSL